MDDVSGRWRGDITLHNLTLWLYGAMMWVDAVDNEDEDGGCLREVHGGDKLPPNGMILCGGGGWS